MIAVDTSVVVAGFASWHEHHDEARRTLDGRPRLVAHCALEGYSVLTRLPAPHRAPPTTVVEFLADRFPDPYLAATEDTYRQLLRLAVDRGISGGAAYDALVALTAGEAGATLASCDRRAVRTYERCGVRLRLLGSPA